VVLTDLEASLGEQLGSLLKQLVSSGCGLEPLDTAVFGYDLFDQP
jgi:hypothetical protein